MDKYDEFIDELGAIDSEADRAALPANAEESLEHCTLGLESFDSLSVAQQSTVFSILEGTFVVLWPAGWPAGKPDFREPNLRNVVESLAVLVIAEAQSTTKRASPQQTRGRSGHGKIDDDDIEKKKQQGRYSGGR